MLSLRLTPELKRRLIGLAHKSGRSKASIAREAILIHIEDLEDFYVAKKRLQNKRPRVDLDDLEREFA
jgi:RHH-type rel operon transcriptional repressor/antitoxin RelB